MHPDSRQLIARILSPSGIPSGPEVPVESRAFGIHQILNPAAPYTGPERRAQGYLVAEVLASAPQAGPPPAV